MFQSKTVLITGIALSVVFLSIRSVSAIQPFLYTKNLNETDDFIFIRGKFFHRGSRDVSSADNNDHKPPALINSASSSADWYSQCLDHEDASCTQKWNQRYWASWDYYRTNGPIFFMFGGEGNAEGIIDANLIWRKFASEYGAVLLVLEHRWYGQSYPTMDTSFESMKLLNSRQALADAARFIQWFKSRMSLENAKLVVFGGSYPGNLAAWFKQMYPNLAKVAVASSAPVEARFEFPEFFRTISEVIYKLDPTCYWKIYAAFNCMEKLVHDSNCNEPNATSSYTDKSELNTALHECNNYDLSKEWQKQIFFYNTGGNWGTNFPGTQSVKKCANLVKQVGNDVIDNYGNYRVAMKEAPESCPTKSNRSVKSQDEVLKFLRSTEGEVQDAKSWVWQTCFEFGYYQTADPVYKLFGNEWNTMIDVFRCTSMFPDAQFTEENIKARIQATNDFYKGKQYNGNCTIFINGQFCPWHSLGLNYQNETSSQNIVISIPRSEHCQDMLADPNASDEIMAAQTTIQTMIGKYLYDPFC